MQCSQTATRPTQLDAPLTPPLLHKAAPAQPGAAPAAHTHQALQHALLLDNLLLLLGRKRLPQGPPVRRHKGDGVVGMRLQEGHHVPDPEVGWEGTAGPAPSAIHVHACVLCAARCAVRCVCVMSMPVRVHVCM